ncbi:MAG: ferric reductase-like transmembrane domain-containing protein [Lunatimonas sp.]|uniref:ferredoxin reductase family protein n=1 Tax=Lunatimonas sp. TaxID=2060141 RepID=UPI00263BC3E8|nr:ferredoxin reductase family protein [Lunatimonas sp.]MCC5939303.1 ferric reductase-like transmembrane domain-containing protein [Lunatimonas sp.]
MNQKPIPTYSYRRGFFWLFIFFVLALIPLFIGYGWNLPDYRGFWEELGLSMGFVGLGLFAVQFLFSGRIRQVAPAFGVDNIVQFHKEMGVIALLFGMAHPVILIAVDSSYWGFFDPRVNLPRALALGAASVGMMLLLVTSLWRSLVGLSYEWWRLLHGLLGSLILFVGIVHALQVGHYLNDWLKMLLFGGYLGGFLYLFVHSRVVRPFQNSKHPYAIDEVIPEKDDCYTLRLKPCTGERLHYEPGQFLWITIQSSPFSMQQHPFSFSSSPLEPLIAITAKRLGDFTRDWIHLKPGQTAFIEGPYGSFTLKDRPCFLVMGGIGVTPAISILKTLAIRQDTRRCILIYGNESWNKIPFRQELAELERLLHLQIVHVLQEPDQAWQGERGLIDERLIGKNLPEDTHAFDYFICGPEPMMDVAERTLRNQGIPWKQIYAERFDLA